MSFAPPIDTVVSKLNRVRKAGGGFTAQCPTHDDKQNSLSLRSSDDGAVLIKCHAGCDNDAIIAALSLEWSDLFPPKNDRGRNDEPTATFPYHDANGNLVYEVVRFAGKRFRQRRPDGRGGWEWNLRGVERVPYCLPELVEGVKAKRTVFVVEGEKDADRLRREGFVATCNSGGAGKWPDEFAAYFAGCKRVAILPDADEPGREHARQIARSLSPVVEDIRVVPLPVPEKGDVSDWLDAGGTPDELKRLTSEAPEWRSEPAEDDAPAATSQIIRLADVTPERVEWLWPGRIPRGKLTLIDGDPGTGKSTVALDLAARVSTGSPMPDGTPGGEPTSVVLLTAEDGLADTVRPRLDAAQGDAARVVVLDAVFDPELDAMRPPSIPKDVERLSELVAAEGAALVVVDVFAAYLGRGVDSYRDQDVRGALMPLATMADRTGAAVVLLRHLSKSGGSKAVYRGGGSIGIIGAARSGLLAAVDPDDDSRQILASSKSNLAAEPPALAYRLVPADEHGCSRVQWEGQTEHRAGDLLRVESDEDRTERDAAESWLKAVLTDGPMRRREVVSLARKEGIAERTLERARERLGVVRERDDDERGRPSTWRLPDYPPPEVGSKPMAVNPQGADQGKRAPGGDFLPTQGTGSKPPNEGDGTGREGGDVEWETIIV